MQSENIGNLAKALSGAQAAMKPPKKAKTAKLGTYSYHYADLADVIEAAREPLSKNGLACVQSMLQRDGHIVLRSVLMHESGEWIASEYPIAAYAKPQEQGSAITYGRRYTLTALLGIAAEDDDDGAAAQEAQPVKVAPKAVPRAVPEMPPVLASGLTREDIEAVHAAAKRAGIKNPTELAPVLTSILGVSKAAEIPRSELQNVLDALAGMERSA